MTFDYIMHRLPENIRNRVIKFHASSIQDLTRWAILAASRLSDQEMTDFAERVRRGEEQRGIICLEEYCDVGTECTRVLEWIRDTFPNDMPVAYRGDEYARR